MAAALPSNALLPNVFLDDDCEDLGFLNKTLSVNTLKQLENTQQKAITFFDKSFCKFFSKPDLEAAKQLFLAIINEIDAGQAIEYLIELQKLAGANGRYFKLEMAREQSSTSTSEEASSSSSEHLVEFEFHMEPNSIINAHTFFPVCVKFENDYESQIKVAKENCKFKQEAHAYAEDAYRCLEGGFSKLNPVVAKQQLKEIYLARTSQEAITALQKLNNLGSSYHFDVKAIYENKAKAETTWQLTATEHAKQRARSKPPVNHLRQVPIDTPKAVFAKEQKVSIFIERLVQAQVIHQRKDTEIIKWIEEFVFTTDIGKKLVLNEKIQHRLSRRRGAQVQLEPTILKIGADNLVMEDQPLTLFIGDFKITSDHQVALLTEQYYQKLSSLGLVTEPKTSRTSSSPLTIGRSTPSNTSASSTPFSTTPTSKPSSVSSSPIESQQTTVLEQVIQAFKQKRMAMPAGGEARGFLETLTSADDIQFLMLAKNNLNRFLEGKASWKQKQPAITSRVITEGQVEYTVYECKLDGMEPITLTRCEGTEAALIQQIQQIKEAESERVDKAQQRTQLVDTCIFQLQGVAVAFHQCHPKAGHPLSLDEKERIKEPYITSIKQQCAEHEKAMYQEKLAGLTISNPHQVSSCTQQVLNEFSQLQQQTAEDIKVIKEQSELPVVAVFKSEADIGAMFEDGGLLSDLYDEETKPDFIALSKKESLIEDRVKSVRAINEAGQHLTEKSQDVAIVITPKCQVLPQTDSTPEHKQFFIVIEVIDHKKEICTPLCILPATLGSDEHAWLNETSPELAKQAIQSQTVVELQQAQARLDKLDLELKQTQEFISEQRAEQKLKQRAWKVIHLSDLKAADHSKVELAEQWSEYVKNIDAIKDGRVTLEETCKHTIAEATKRHEEIFAALINLTAETIQTEDYKRITEAAKRQLQQLKQAKAMFVTLSKNQDQLCRTPEYERVLKAELALNTKLDYFENNQLPQQSPQSLIRRAKELCELLVASQSAGNEVVNAVEGFKQEYLKKVHALKESTYPTTKEIEAQFAQEAENVQANADLNTLKSIAQNCKELDAITTAMNQVLATVEALHQGLKQKVAQPWTGITQVSRDVAGARAKIAKVTADQLEVFTQYDTKRTQAENELIKGSKQLKDEAEKLKAEIAELQEKAIREVMQKNDKGIASLQSQRRELSSMIDDELREQAQFDPKSFYQKVGNGFDPILAPDYVMAN